MDSEQLGQRFRDLASEADQAQMANTRTGHLAAMEKAREAASVAGLIGGAEGASCRVRADLLIANSLCGLRDMAAAARAACAALGSARASGNRSSLVRALIRCGIVANQAPGEMATAERESREQERLGGSASYGGLDLSQEGRISLPTTPATLSRLGLAYNEAAVAICDAALAAAGGRGSPAAAEKRRVPSLLLEANARGLLGGSLHKLDEKPQRSLEILWQAVALLRRAVQTAAPGFEALQAKLALASLLTNMGAMLGLTGRRGVPGPAGMAEGERRLREALELSEETDDVALKQHVLLTLCNMSGRIDQSVGPAEAAAFRSRLNALDAQAGRNPDTSCTICLEPLDGGAEEDAADDGGRGADGYKNSDVYVLECGLQFHRGCLSTWWRTASSSACPLCKE